MLRIGTSGYYYKDWAGKFYPSELKAEERLAFYAREFNTVEINSTYYRMPTPAQLTDMARRVPDDFIFTVKTPHEMTHERNAEATFFNRFRDALQPLIEMKKFGAVLAQFPYAFHHTPTNTEYLKRFRQQLGDLPIVIEFRTADWLSEQTREKTLAFLREQELGFCCVDLPVIKSLPPILAELTSAVAYVRFHGRNAATWWEHEESYQRYDYHYQKEELAEWIPKIQKLDTLAEKVFVFANNHYNANAVETARELKTLLGVAT